MVPLVGVIPYTPAALAGKTLEPPVSVPMAKGLKPADILTPEPDEDPAEIYFGY